MIKYKLLNNGTAVILSRHPKVVYERVKLVFSGAPENTTAIVECNGSTAYYKASDCKLHCDKLSGVIKVTVAVLDDSVPLKKWTCEELNAEKLKDGGVLITPNDLNLPQAVANLRLENNAIREENAEIKEEIAALNKRLDKIMSGYKFI